MRGKCQHKSIRVYYDIESSLLYARLKSPSMFTSVILLLNNLKLRCQKPTPSTVIKSSCLKQKQSMIYPRASTWYSQSGQSPKNLNEHVYLKELSYLQARKLYFEENINKKYNSI